MVGLRNVYVYIIVICTKEKVWFVLYRNSDIKRPWWEDSQSD